MHARELTLPARRVFCHLEFDLEEPTVLALQIAAAAQPQDIADENLDVTINGASTGPVPEFTTSPAGLTAGSGAAALPAAAAVRRITAAAAPQNDFHA